MKRVLLAIVSLAIGFACLAPIATPTALAHPAYTWKQNSHNGIAWYGVPFGYIEYVRTGISQYTSGSTTTVFEANWGAVVPYGRTYPAPMDAVAYEYLIASNGSSWTVPNNYPYCFVDARDTYSCGDSRSINHAVTNTNGSAKAKVWSLIITHDDINSYLNPTDYWALNTFP